MHERRHPEARSRSSAALLWLGAALLLLLVVTAALAFVHRDFLSFAISAFKYRHGDYQRIWEISDYCRVHYREFTEDDLVA